MSNDDITVEILKDIRDEIRSTRRELSHEIQKTNSRLDAHIEETRTGFRVLREELSTRILAGEMRTATAITELAGTMHDVRDLLKDRLDLRDRVERCEQDIADIKRRLD